MNQQAHSSIPDTLEKRHNIEEQFHDRKTQANKAPSSRMDFYGSGVTEEHEKILMKAVGDLRGKTVLDFGCSVGHTTRIYAKLGAARVDGFDISGESIEMAKRLTAKEGLDHVCRYKHLAAEEIDYPDGVFDVVIGKAILHHTDLEKTSKQLFRVMKPGGVAYFLEPLDHNPFLNLFRRLTPSRRTPTEKPLSVHDLDYFRKYFNTVEYRGIHLLTLLAQGMLVITGSKRLHGWFLRRLRGVEDPFLRRFPSLQKYCWTALMIFKKS